MMMTTYAAKSNNYAIYMEVAFVFCLDSAALADPLVFEHYLHHQTHCLSYRIQVGTVGT